MYSGRLYYLSNFDKENQKNKHVTDFKLKGIFLFFKLCLVLEKFERKYKNIKIKYKNKK